MADFDENIAFINGSVYDDENAPDGGDTMKVREILAVIFDKLEITQADAARECGMSPQQLNGKLTRASMRADEFLELLDVVGIDVEYRIRSTGKEVRPWAKGYGRRIRCMVDGVKYDTNSAEPLSNSFYADGVNEYMDGVAMELYLDKSGRYYFAEYSSLANVKDRICPATAEEAAAFIEKYGTELFRNHPTEQNT